MSELIPSSNYKWGEDFGRDKLIENQWHREADRTYFEAEAKKQEQNMLDRAKLKKAD